MSASALSVLQGLENSQSSSPPKLSGGASLQPKMPTSTLGAGPGSNVASLTQGKGGTAYDGSGLSYYQNPNNFPGMVSGFEGNQTYRPPGTGNSPWLAMATQQLNQNTDQLKQAAAGTSSQAMNSAWNGLASSGGLSGGARERAAYSSGQAGATAQNQIGQTQEANRLGLGVQDAATNNANQQADANRAMQAAQDANNYNLQKYDIGGKSAAAQVLANAQAQAGGGGGTFICTELRKQELTSKEEHRSIQKFMAKYLLKGLFSGAHFFHWYLKNGPKIVEKAKETGINWVDVKRQLVDDTLYMEKHHGRKLAEEHYAKTCYKLSESLGMPVPKYLWKRSISRSIPVIPKVLANPLIRKFIKFSLGGI